MGKFFNEKVYRDESDLKKKVIIIASCLSAVILIILVAILVKNALTPKLVMKSELTVQLNDELPAKKDFFEIFKNYSEDKVTIDYSYLDMSKIGSYIVKIDTADQGNNSIIVYVTDTTAPNLTIKDVAIGSGQTYNIMDFIENCSDNSHAECQISYYDMIDENGQTIDYASFKEDGIYTIKLIAEDIYGNKTNVMIAKLKIGESSEENINYGKDCAYGDLTPNSDIPMAVIVGNENTGCAINRDLWDDNSLLDTVNNLYMKDYERLKKQMSPILNEKFPNGAKIVVTPNFVNIYNEQLTGLVGYAIYVKLYVADANVGKDINNDKYLVSTYYIKQDGSRIYNTNKYNLEK